MAICEHKNVIYQGNQGTLDPNKILKLYGCVHCGSTIILKEGKEYNIIKNKEDSIVDIINILKDYINYKTK